MDENIRRRLSILRAEAYNEGFAAGKKEGYAAAIQELNEVMGSLSSISAAASRHKTNSEHPPSETDQLVVEYLKESPGKTALQIAADLGVHSSRAYRMTDKGLLVKFGSKFYDRAYQPDSGA